MSVEYIIMKTYLIVCPTLPISCCLIWPIGTSQNTYEVAPYQQSRTPSMGLTTYTESLILLLSTLVAGEVQIYSPFGLEPPVAEFLDLPAAFGDTITSKGIPAYFVYANPELACTPIEPPPKNFTNPSYYWGVLIKRGNCTYEEKIFIAQTTGYSIAIVHNVNSDELVTMPAENPGRIWLPSVFVGETTGKIIKSKYLYNYGFMIRIVEKPSYDFNPKMMIPFLVVVSVCMIVMIGVMIAKCIKDYRRARRRRLPYSTLSQIPTTKFRKGDPYETCAICLDDFIEGEKLRVLPCSHSYHCKCIDPWLTGNRRVCPMCKRKVFAQNERNVSDDDSTSEDDDHTPLLRNSQPRTGGGIFSSLSPDSRALLIHSYLGRRINSEERNPGPSVRSENSSSYETFSERNASA